MKRHHYPRRLRDALLAIAVIVAVLLAVALFFPWSEAALVWSYASRLPWPLSWIVETVAVPVVVALELLVLYGLWRLGEGIWRLGRETGARVANRLRQRR